MDKFQFDENDIIRCLDQAGLKWKNNRRYLLVQCPTHEDKNPSAQIYKDDWFVNCHAVCGRYPIQQAFPNLVDDSTSYQPVVKKEGKMPEYKTVNLIEEWEALPLIPDDHTFKNLSIDTLNDLGWRWDEENNRYFIPYWNMHRDQIPFAQWRYLQGETRFTFWKDARPLAYGLWNLVDASKLFVVEGASDCAVMEYCAVPWIGLPSASSGDLMKKMARYCTDQGIEIIYAGDNDEAGDKLRDALDESGTHYRVLQPPKQFKDWGDFFVSDGLEAVQTRCFNELVYRVTEIEKTAPTGLETVMDVFPGAKVLVLVGDEGKSVGVEQQKPPPPQVLF